MYTLGLSDGENYDVPSTIGESDISLGIAGFSANNYVGSSNPYIPWDTGVLTTFSSFIKSSIGSATTVGILVFSIILGISIAIMVIRRWTRS